MVKQSKMAGDGGSKKRIDTAGPGTAASMREDLSFLFETQELKEKKESKRNLKHKPTTQSLLTMKGNKRGKKRATKRRKRLTASETLSSKSKDKTRDLLEPEYSDNEDEQHSVTTRKLTKPSASQRAIVSRSRQHKRFSVPREASSSSSAMSLSKSSDNASRPLHSQSCSSLSSWVSGTLEPRIGRSRTWHKPVKTKNPSTSGDTSRRRFRRRNSPHPRLFKAKRAKHRNRKSQSRSSSTTSSGSRNSNPSRRQTKRNRQKTISVAAVSKKASKTRDRKMQR